MLLEAGVDVHVIWDNAFWTAATNGHLPVLRHLLLCSKDELHQDARDEVVKFLASQSSEVLADMLLEAQQRGHSRVVRLLREAAGRR